MKHLAVRARLLLSIYAFAPALVVLALLDTFLLDGAIREALPSLPGELWWYVVLFNVPHHVASLFSMADREYLSFYRSKLIFGLPLVLGAFGLLYLYSSTLALIAFVLYTEYHVMSQHEGIFRLFARARSKLHDVWKWLGVAVISVGYGLTSVAGEYSALLQFLHAYAAVPILLAAFFGVTIAVVIQSPKVIGKIFALAIAGVVASTFTLLAMGYVFLGILASRFVHDIAAFAFYLAHDHNRAVNARTNFLYRAFAFTKIPVLVLSPVLAIALGVLLQKAPFIPAAVLFCVFVTHYYVESFVWKREGIHRKQIQIA